MSAWNNWYHCNGNTYGTWVRGDPREWRSRGHHEHVEGDYKNPPPKRKYKKEFEQSKKLIKREPVEIPMEARGVACQVMIESLLFRLVEVIAFGVGKKHWHGLLRFVPLDSKKSQAIAIAGFAKNRSPRFLVGIAKKRAARALSEMGWVETGGVWAGRGGVKPIKDRPHQLNSANYIRDHLLEGAVVYYMGKFYYPKGFKK